MHRAYVEIIRVYTPYKLTARPRAPARVTARVRIRYSGPVHPVLRWACRVQLILWSCSNRHYGSCCCLGYAYSWIRIAEDSTVYTDYSMQHLEQPFRTGCFIVLTRNIHKPAHKQCYLHLHLNLGNQPHQLQDVYVGVRSGLVLRTQCCSKEPIRYKMHVGVTEDFNSLIILTR